MTLDTNLLGRSASRLGGALSCGIVHNRLAEVRRTDMHEGVVVSWLLSGTGALVMDGRTQALTPGCTCLRRPDRAYSMALDAQTDHIRCFLRLPEESYPLLCRLMPGLRDAPAVHPLPYREKTLRRIAAFVDALQRTSDQAAYQLLPEAIDLLYALTALPAPEKERDALARAAALLASPAQFRLSLAAIAEAAGLSYAALRKGFPARYGVSPGQFRLQKRMELARQALASGDSILVVSERYGFSDVYAFSKQFKAFVGETPGEYRRHHID